MRKTIMSFLAIMSALIALAVASLGASANTYEYADSYCNSVVAPYSQCGQDAIGNYDSNIAWYPGSGTVNVCEHTYRESDLATLSRRCGNNYIGSYADLCATYNQHVGGSMYAYAGNNSGSWHTVDGYAAYALNQYGQYVYDPSGPC